MINLKEKFAEYSGSVAALTRYVGTFAGGAAMMVGVLGINAMSQNQVDALFEAFKQLGTAVSSALTALGTIAGIASAVYGAWKSTRAQQAKTAAQVPGVQIHVDTAIAPPSIVKLAEATVQEDPKAKDIVPMDGPHRDEKEPDPAATKGG